MRDRFAEYQFGQRDMSERATCYLCKRDYPECDMQPHWERDWERVCADCYGDGTDYDADAREYDSARRGAGLPTADGCIAGRCSSLGWAVRHEPAAGRQESR